MVRLPSPAQEKPRPQFSHFVSVRQSLNLLLWICDLVTSGVVSAACLVAGRPQLPPDTLNLFMTSRECGGSISPNSLERFQLAHRQIPWLI